ncbi:cell wall hydrolase [Paenibacillus sp. P26]|nr:cell wall hydrolase [Paenibacillus sp. P26]
MATYGEKLTDQTGLSEFNGQEDEDLLARLIYSEARGESVEGWQAVGHVVRNRKVKNTSEFGGGTYSGVILKPGQFVGMTTAAAREPDTSTKEWNDILYIALTIDNQTNPIGKALWFWTNTLFDKNSRTTSTGQPQLYFVGKWQDVTYKKVIGNHTFFLVAGY